MVYTTTMQAYNYKAYDKSGKICKDVLEAESERHLRQQLRERGLMPIELSPVSVGRTLFQFKSKFKGNNLMLLTRQLATLVGSGMPLEQSLRLMAEQAENVTIKRLVSAIRSQVSEGQSLAHALEKAPAIFPSDYIATISAGEETGHLEQVLERLADDVEHSGKAKQSMMTALIYPLLMMTVAITVIILLLVYVVPQVTRVFGQMDQELPGLTLALLAISGWLKNYGFYLFVLLTGSLVTFLLMLRDIEKKKKWHGFLLKIPRLGYWFIVGNVSGWARSLGMLLGSGVPALDSLRIASERVDNLALKSDLDEVANRVREGDSLHQALLKTDRFPPFLIHMVSSGESSGALDKMLLKVADYYDQRLKTVIDTGLKLFEPLLVIMMGGVVLLIVMAVLVPIIQMNQLI